MNDLAEMFIYLVLALMGFMGLLGLTQAMFGFLVKSKPASLSRSFEKSTLAV